MTRVTPWTVGVILCSALLPQPAAAVDSCVIGFAGCSFNDCPFGAGSNSDALGDHVCKLVGECNGHNRWLVKLTVSEGYISGHGWVTCGDPEAEEPQVVTDCDPLEGGVGVHSCGPGEVGEAGPAYCHWELYPDQSVPGSNGSVACPDPVDPTTFGPHILVA